MLACLAGEPIKYVRIGEEPECVSWVTYTLGGKGTVEAIIGILAGPYAEHRAATGEPMKHVPFEEYYAPVDELLRTGELPKVMTGDDAQICFRMLLLVEREKAKAFYNLACICVAMAVENYWPEIETVADQLWEVGYLEGAEVVRLIEASLRRRR